MIASELSVVLHGVLVIYLVPSLQTWDSKPGTRLGLSRPPCRARDLPHYLVHYSPKRTRGALDLQVEHQGTLRRGRI